MTPVPRDLVIAYNNWTADVRRARIDYLGLCPACLTRSSEPGRRTCWTCRHRKDPS